MSFQWAFLIFTMLTLLKYILSFRLRLLRIKYNTHQGAMRAHYYGASLFNRSRWIEKNNQLQ